MKQVWMTWCRSIRDQQPLKTVWIDPRPLVVANAWGTRCIQEEMGAESGQANGAIITSTNWTPDGELLFVRELWNVHGNVRLITHPYYALVMALSIESKTSPACGRWEQAMWHQTCHTWSESEHVHIQTKCNSISPPAALLLCVQIWRMLLLQGNTLGLQFVRKLYCKGRRN